VAKNSTELRSPHPHGIKASSSDTPAMDLMDYLTQKKSIHQIAPQCCCERLISSVLSECHCSSNTSKLLVFNQLSVALASNSAKGHFSHRKKSLSNEEYPEVTSNMVGPSTTPSKSKGKQLAVNSEESDAE